MSWIRKLGRVTVRSCLCVIAEGAFVNLFYGSPLLSSAKRPLRFTIPTLHPDGHLSLYSLIILFPSSQDLLILREIGATYTVVPLIPSRTTLSPPQYGFNIDTPLPATHKAINNHIKNSLYTSSKPPSAPTTEKNRLTPTTFNRISLRQISVYFIPSFWIKTLIREYAMPSLR